MIVRKIEFPSPDPDYPQFIALLKDVYVSRRGLILDRNFRLIPQVNFNIEFWPRYCPAYGSRDVDTIVRRERTRQTVAELPGDVPYIYGVHYFGMYVFGHLWDTLQPLMKIEQAGPREGVLLVNHFTGHVNELSRHFELMSYDDSRRQKVRSMTFVPELWYPSVACYPGRIAPEGRDWLRRKYMGADSPIRRRSNQTLPGLYLNRNAPEGRDLRRVCNNDEVISVLKGHGFHVLHGCESLDEHIELFGGAQRITGPHGSMFRNILFSGPDCRVLEFCPDNRLDMAQLELGRVCGLDYQLLEVAGDKDNNISIDPDTLDRWISSAPIENTRR